MKWLHWGIALLVIVMLFGGFFLDDVPPDMQSMAFMMHKSVGLTILLLMVLRLLYVTHHGRPPLPTSTPHWEWVLSRLVQNAFYLFLIMMPLSGWIMSAAAGRPPVWFGLFTLKFPGIAVDKAFAKTVAEWHETIAFILLGLLFLHVAGALKHHFVNRDNVLRRMLPGG